MDKNKKNKLKSAFSLPEFLIVIAILVILVGLAVPAFKSYQPNLQLSGSARNLVTDFRYAQQLAVAEQVEYGIYFYPLDKKYEIVKYGAATGTIKEVVLPGEISSLTLSQEILDNNNVVKYNPYGSVDVSGTVFLQNSENATTVLEIKPSGFINILN